MKLTLDQMRVNSVPQKMKHFAIMKDDVGKFFVTLYVSPPHVVHRIVTRQELLNLEKFVLSWYELSEIDINFIPEEIKSL